MCICVYVKKTTHPELCEVFNSALFWRSLHNDRSQKHPFSLLHIILSGDSITSIHPFTDRYFGNVQVLAIIKKLGQLTYFDQYDIKYLIFKIATKIYWQTG